MLLLLFKRLIPVRLDHSAPHNTQQGPPTHPQPRWPGAPTPSPPQDQELQGGGADQTQSKCCRREGQLRPAYFTVFLPKVYSNIQVSLSFTSVSVIRQFPAKIFPQ